MMENLYDNLHIKLFEEIINGELNPTKARFNNANVLKGLIEEVNTIKVAVLPATENTLEFIEKTDFTLFGYKSQSDYDLDIRRLSNGKHEIYIKPLSVYEPLEVVEIPIFNSFKCNCYLELLGDEFERITVRAEKILDNANDAKQTGAYASKHVQKSKKLFHDAKRRLKEVQKNNNTEDIYIFFILSLFIIRTILFYQKMFRPYLKLQPDTEEKLMHEVLTILSLKKLCSLFQSEKSGDCKVCKKSLIENIVCSEGDVKEDHARYEKISYNKKSQPVSTGTSTYERIKVNGQINVLVDVFLQMLDKIKVKEGMFIETSRTNLRDFFLANFNDKKDKPYSYHTLNTYLKPQRTDKRIKDESDRKIDLSEFLDSE
jgi:hypothetical protein